jgi:hypothetical protein
VAVFHRITLITLSGWMQRRPVTEAHHTRFGKNRLIPLHFTIPLKKVFTVTGKTLVETEPIPTDCFTKKAHHVSGDHSTEKYTSMPREAAHWQH